MIGESYPLIDDLIGRDFEHGGRGPDRFDCWGLCVEIYRRLGRKLPDEPTPAAPADKTAAMLSHADKFDKVPNPEPWSLVLFRVIPNWHIGVVLPNKAEFIHVVERQNVVRERLDNPRWTKMRLGYYVYKG